MTLSERESTDVDAMAQPDLQRLVVVSGGTSDPSSTRLLAERVAGKARKLLEAHGTAVQIDVIDLRELANEVVTAIVSGLYGPRLERAVALLRDADGLIVSSPVYKAGASGLVTAFFQVLDNDLLIGKPVVLAATAGSSRHALVIDDQMRGLFAYLRTITVPTSLFAASDEWSSTSFGERIDRAATELALLVLSGFQHKLRADSWESYQHSYGSGGGIDFTVNFDSDLMKLANGGSSPR